MTVPYILAPDWTWLITLALFVAGVASGTYAVLGLIEFAGNEADRPVATRLGFIPMPLMLLVPILLILDLGQPGRFLNLILRSQAAPERGPFPLMINPNSPMSLGGYVILIFAGFTLIAFLESLRRTGRLNLPLVGGLSRNVVFLAIGEAFALATSAYSGVLINVTNQGVWSDTFLMGALFVAFSELSGLAVAAIVAAQLHASGTAVGVRSALFGAAAVSAVILVIFLAQLGVAGSLRALAASLLVGPVFWVGAVGAGLVVPLVVTSRRNLWRTPDRLALLGVVVLIGVLAFRYAMFFSSIAFVEG